MIKASTAELVPVGVQVSGCWLTEAVTEVSVELKPRI